MVAVFWAAIERPLIAGGHKHICNRKLGWLIKTQHLRTQTLKQTHTHSDTHTYTWLRKTWFLLNRIWPSFCSILHRTFSRGLLLQLAWAALGRDLCSHHAYAMMARPFTPFLTTLLIRTVCWLVFYFYYHVNGLACWLAGWLGVRDPFWFGQLRRS